MEQHAWKKEAAEKLGKTENARAKPWLYNAATGGRDTKAAPPLDENHATWLQENPSQAKLQT